MSRVGVIGEALVDVLPGPDASLAARPGGSPANVAVALARLGIDTAFLGRTSTDRWGRWLRDHLASQGVATTGPQGPEPTAIAFVDVTADGQASYRFLWDGTADRQLDPVELATAIETVDVVHTGSVACILPPASDAILAAVSQVHSGVVTFDPNVRPALMADMAAGRARLLDLAGHAHLVKLSDEDLAVLFPGQDVNTAVAALLGGPRTQVVVVTTGDTGAQVSTSRFQVSVPTADAGPVVDTVGAGDTFMAGLLAGLDDAGALSVPGLATLDADIARDAATLAARAAAVVVARAGADPPRRDELP